MSNEQKQPQEGKPLTAEEFWEENSRSYPEGYFVPDDFECITRDEFMEYAQQSAALREELEIEKAALEGKEQEKQEYIDKYNLAISELEYVKKSLEYAKKERARIFSDCQEMTEVLFSIHGTGRISVSDMNIINRIIADQNAQGGNGANIYPTICTETVYEKLEKQLTEVTRQRDEAAELLRRAPESKETVTWWRQRKEFLSSLSSGKTKPVRPWISVEERLPAEEFVLKMAEKQTTATPDLPVNGTELGFAIRCAKEYAAQETAALREELGNLKQELDDKKDSPGWAAYNHAVTETGESNMRIES